MRKAFRYKLRPTKEQEGKLISFAGQARFVYNELLVRHQRAYKEGEKKSVNKFALMKEVTGLKGEFEWLRESHVHSLQASAEHLAAAYTRWFEYCKKRKAAKTEKERRAIRKVGKPTFKKKHVRKLIFKNDPKANTVRVVGDRVRVPKIGMVRFRKSRELEGEIKRISISQDPCGDWFVSISCEVLQVDLPKSPNTIGIDAGLTHYAILSNGEKIENPRWLRKGSKKTRRLQRSFSRKKKGSKNSAKARGKLAKHHRRIANKRKDFQHKLSTRLINENQVIGCESLNIAGMMRGNVAKSFSDAGHSEFVRQLQYKCEWYGRTLVKADRFFASTKTCNSCGEKSDISRGTKEWTCQCGVHHDRDVNAAINLKNMAEGYPDINACGVHVRLACQQ